MTGGPRNPGRATADSCLDAATTRSMTEGVRSVTEEVRSVTEGVRSVTEGVRSMTEGVRSVTEGVRSVTGAFLDAATARSMTGRCAV